MRLLEDLLIQFRQRQTWHQEQENTIIRAHNRMKALVAENAEISKALDALDPAWRDKL